METPFICKLANYFVLLPIVIALYRWKGLIKVQELLLLMLTIIAVNQVVAAFWIHYVEKNNLPFYYSYILVELFFYILIGIKLLRETISKKFFFFLVLVFCGISLSIFIFNAQDIHTYPDAIRGIEGTIVVFISVSYFIKVFRESNIIYLNKDFGFWFCAGSMVYFLSNFMLFIYGEMISLQAAKVWRSIWIIHACLNILLYISYAIALLCRKTEKIS